MEHGIPLSRRAPLVHIARISREEWRPLVAVVRVRYYISKARFDGPEREKVTTQRSRSSRPPYNVSRGMNISRPRSSTSCGSRRFRAIEFFTETGARSTRLNSRASVENSRGVPPDGPLFGRAHPPPVALCVT